MTPAGQSAPPTAGQAAGRRHHWIVFSRDGGELAVSFVDQVEHAEVLRLYPDAFAAMPRFEPTLIGDGRVLPANRGIRGDRAKTYTENYTAQPKRSGK
jgi:hypothetical protein